VENLLASPSQKNAEPEPEPEPRRFAPIPKTAKPPEPEAEPDTPFDDAVNPEPEAEPENGWNLAQAVTLRRAIDAFSDPARGRSQLAPCSRPLVDAIRRKAESYGMTGFEVAALLERRLKACQLSPSGSTWPQGFGWFVSLVEQEGKDRAKPMGEQMAALAQAKRMGG
jgi:hypothetical protein